VQALEQGQLPGAEPGPSADHQLGNPRQRGRAYRTRSQPGIAALVAQASLGQGGIRLGQRGQEQLRARAGQASQLRAAHANFPQGSDAGIQKLG
jgi:hypothetical protein